MSDVTTVFRSPMSHLTSIDVNLAAGKGLYLNLTQCDMILKQYLTRNAEVLCGPEQHDALRHVKCTLPWVFASEPKLKSLLSLTKFTTNVYSTHCQDPQIELQMYKSALQMRLRMLIALSLHWAIVFSFNLLTDNNNKVSDFSYHLFMQVLGDSHCHCRPCC